MAMEMTTTEEIMEQYFDKPIVTVLTAIRTESRFLEDTARRISQLKFVEDVFVVTGDCDIFVKAKFPSYADFKNFIMNELSKIEGVTETKTMLVITTYKERGLIFED